MHDFRDRYDAGARLAQRLRAYAERPDVVVLALPRGGVPVGYEVATSLGVPLDALVVRKLGVPGRRELAMGAIAAGGVEVVDRSIVAALGISPAAFDAVRATERAELERREQLLRGGRPPLEVRGKTVIVVDDGLATGSTMRAAVEGLRLRGPAAVIIAVPVASFEACAALRPYVDDLVCLLEPPQLHAIGLWYAEFEQTTDAEVQALLAAAARALETRADRAAVAHPTATT